MKNIEVKILNPQGLIDAQKAMLAGATLTQKSHKIYNMDDFLEIYDKEIDPKRVAGLASLPHPALQKLGSCAVMLTGISRRALAQITRHQNEVKFMAGSLQYSDHSKVQKFVMPPVKEPERTKIAWAYESAALAYDELVAKGVDRDIAGYVLPQGFRTSLMMVATPYQLKYMIKLRTCKRNTEEVRYIFLKLAKELIEIAPELFSGCYPDCYYQDGKCPEGKMTCGSRMLSTDLNPEGVIKE